MSLLAHLAELRARLIKSLAAMALACVLAWNLAPAVLGLLLAPLETLLPDQRLVFTGLQDGFIATLKISLWSGFLLSSPFWLYQVWAFVAPALYPAEKKHVGRLALLASSLMAAGVLFAYFAVFPLTFRFFLGFAGEALAPLPAVDRYLALAMSFLLAFGLAFQLPLLLMFLAWLGLLDAGFLRKNRPYAVIAIFVAAAFLTPPDVVSQILLAAALLVLYELSIFLVARQHTKQKAA